MKSSYWLDKKSCHFSTVKWMLKIIMEVLVIHASVGRWVHPECLFPSPRLPSRAPPFPVYLLININVCWPYHSKYSMVCVATVHSSPCSPSSALAAHSDVPSLCTLPTMYCVAQQSNRRLGLWMTPGDCNKLLWLSKEFFPKHWLWLSNELQLTSLINNKIVNILWDWLVHIDSNDKVWKAFFYDYPISFQIVWLLSHFLHYCEGHVFRQPFSLGLKKWKHYVLLPSRGAHGSDWCWLGQIRHQSVTYGLTDLKSVTNPWLLKSDPIRSVDDRIRSD